MTRRGDSAESRTWTLGRLLGFAIVVASFAFWIWAFSPWAPRTNPDRLEDRAFTEAAESRCAAALERIAVIPSARTAESPQDRAGQVADGTDEVESMVADLRSLAADVRFDTERDILDKWFSDWDQYVADRWDHVARLTAADEDATGRELAFVLSNTVGGGIYTERLDGFARVNDMDSCLIPGDV